MENKKYFAKLLPVEGEIKKGDKYITECGNIYTSDTSDHSDIIKATSKKQFDKYFKKVKLFLCSRDIQKGDQIYLTKEKEYHKFQYETKDRITCQTLNGIHDEDFDIQDRFKVIGEISPDATWVKEGDEFDEEDIRFAFSIPYEDYDWATYDEWKENKHDYWKTIQIKGPCGYLH